MLFYPVADANFDTPSYMTYQNGYWLTRDAMKWYWSNYLTNQTNVKDPTVSPLQASIEQLKGLPPALIINGENDVLRDEGEAYALKLLEGEGKIGTTGRTVWSGLFDAAPDLTNRVESIFADTEGNVCAEVVLSGTLAKEFAGMMSPNRYYVLPHAFILKIGGEETRIQRTVANWDLPKV